MKMIKLAIITLTFITMSFLVSNNANAAKFNFSASITLVAKPAAVSTQEFKTASLSQDSISTASRYVNSNDNLVEFIYE